MTTFESLEIISDNNNVNIKEGAKLDLGGAMKTAKGNSLTLVLTSNADLFLPPGEYEEIKVITSNGNCNINLPNSSVLCIEFFSSCGDLTVNTNCQDVTFHSPCGRYFNRTNKANNSSYFSSSRMTVKEDSLINPTIWVKGERYK